MIPQLLLTLVVLMISLSVDAQESQKKRMPLAVSHLPAENKALTRRKDAPSHNIFTMVLCFKKKCRAYVGWRTGQRRNRFKGYKDGGTPPKRHDEKIQTDRDTVIAKAPPVRVEKPAKDTTKVELKQLFILDEVLFEVNSARLNDHFTYKLDSLVTLLDENKKLNVTVTGHTDNTGDENFNRKLSNDRAKAVAQYLVAHHISANRITHNGMGSSSPIFSNDSEQGRRRNRRVEILVVGQ
jgi:outer membrane protein OmpA-like peptidoglycan-associated protein